jgi:hypothetical protein
VARRVSGVRAGTAFATVDFDRPDRQIGFVMIPQSPDEDAWGVTRMPIAILARQSMIEATKARPSTSSGSSPRSAVVCMLNRLIQASTPICLCPQGNGAWRRPSDHGH